VFGYQHVEVDGMMTHDLVNPNGPSALMYAWTGAFIGALIRPLGGMLADKMGGAKVTQIISVIMLLSALGVAWFLKLAYSSATPEQYFIPFLLLFLVLFAATGIGNGSTFRTISQVFNKERVQQGTGRPRSGLDISHRSVRCILYTESIRRTNQGDDTGKCTDRFCRFLRCLHPDQLVVLSA